MKNKVDNIFDSEPLTDKVIVLDIDETLAHTNENSDSYINMMIFTSNRSLLYRERIYRFMLDDFDDVGSGKKVACWGAERPHVHEFITFCFNYFKYVIVWSAGKRSYVYAMTDILFKCHQRPHLILTYDDLVTINGVKTKPLSVVSNMIHIDISKIWLLDDKPYTNFISNPSNGISIPEYSPEETHDELLKDDKCLPELMKWFSHLEEVEDVREVDTSRIFSK